MKEGFESLSRSAENNFAAFPEVVDLASRSFPDSAETIEEAAGPRTLEARVYLARCLLLRGMYTDRIDAFLSGGDVPAAARRELINILLEKYNFSSAHKAWRASLPQDSDLPDELVFDGGFEHTTSGDEGAFGWRIDQEMSGVAAARTRQHVHSGNFALDLAFSGRVEIGRTILSQLMLVRPNSRYLLKLFYRSPEMFSASPPLFIVTDPAGNELGRSEALADTADKWVEISIAFRTVQASAVDLALIRPACSLQPCPLVGKFTLDDVSLTPQDPQPRSLD